MICFRTDWWEGQNKRTGDVGEFPEIVFTLVPLRAATVDNSTHTAGTKQPTQTKVKTNSGKNALDQPLIDFGNLASMCVGITAGDSATGKAPPFSNWTTFESTTDLQQAAETNPVSSADGKVTPDAGIPQADGSTLRNCSDLSSNSSRPNNTITKCSSENFDDRRHASINADGRDGVDYDAKIDVSDSALLLPVVSQTSLSEPCSPAHAAGVDNPNLIVNDNEARGFCHSLPASNMSDRLSWMTSASCENLNSSVVGASHHHRLCNRSQFDEHLSKASSDMSVYIGGGNAPPVPPRDYPSRHKSGDAVTCRQRSIPKSHAAHQHTEIHPIVQDGQRRSSTHYWLLPEKQRFDALPPFVSDTEPISYVNIPDGRSGREGKSARKATKPQPLFAPAAEISHSQMDDMMKKLDIGMADRPLESMSEIHDMVNLIRVDVGFDAVTFEESLSALSLNHWSVQDAIQYIKVEHLFRVGIASRDVCREALLARQWNLDNAASYLIDIQSRSADHHTH